MTKLTLLKLAALVAGGFILNSCCGSCCTGVAPAPQILPLPEFNPLHTGK